MQLHHQAKGINLKTLNYVYMYEYVHVECSVCGAEERTAEILELELWAAHYRNGEPNSGPLQEQQQSLLTAELLPYP